MWWEKEEASHISAGRAYGRKKPSLLTEQAMGASDWSAPAMAFSNGLRVAWLTARFTLAARIPWGASKLSPPGGGYAWLAEVAAAGAGEDAAAPPGHARKRSIRRRSGGWVESRLASHPSLSSFLTPSSGLIMNR